MGDGSDAGEAVAALTARMKHGAVLAHVAASDRRARNRSQVANDSSEELPRLLERFTDALSAISKTLMPEDIVASAASSMSDWEQRQQQQQQQQQEHQQDAILSRPQTAGGVSERFSMDASDPALPHAQQCFFFGLGTRPSPSLAPSGSFAERPSTSGGRLGGKAHRQLKRVATAAREEEVPAEMLARPCTPPAFSLSMRRTLTDSSSGAGEGASVHGGGGGGSGLLTPDGSHRWPAESERDAESVAGGAPPWGASSPTSSVGAASGIGIGVGEPGRLSAARMRFPMSSSMIERPKPAHNLLFDDPMMQAFLKGDDEGDDEGDNGNNACVDGEGDANGDGPDVLTLEEEDPLSDDGLDEPYWKHGFDSESESAFECTGGGGAAASSSGRGGPNDFVTRLDGCASASGSPLRERVRGGGGGGGGGKGHRGGGEGGAEAFESEGSRPRGKNVLRARHRRSESGAALCISDLAFDDMHLLSPAQSKDLREGPISLTASPEATPWSSSAGGAAGVTGGASPTFGNSKRRQSQQQPQGSSSGSTPAGGAAGQQMRGPGLGGLGGSSLSCSRPPLPRGGPGGGSSRSLQRQPSPLGDHRVLASDQLHQQQMQQEQKEAVPRQWAAVEEKTQKLHWLASDLVSQGVGDKCRDTYKAVRRLVLSRSVENLEVAEVGVAAVERMAWAQLEPHMRKWLRDAEALALLLFEGEKQLCCLVLGGLQLSTARVLADIVGSAGLLSALARVARNGYAVARAAPVPERLFALLDMYACTRNLLPVVEDVCRVSGGVGSDNALWELWQGLPRALGGAVLATVDDLHSILHAGAKAAGGVLQLSGRMWLPLPGRGRWKQQREEADDDEEANNRFGEVGVHSLTSYVVNYVRQLLDTKASWSKAVEEVYATCGGTKRSADGDAARLLNALDKNVKAKARKMFGAGAGPGGSEAASPAAAAAAGVVDESVVTAWCLFCLNNSHYICSSVTQLNLKTADKHKERVERHTESFEMAALRRLLGALGPGHSEGLDEEEVKTRLRKFNLAFEELALDQRAWAITADDCRKAVKARLAQRVKDTYEDFLEPHRNALSSIPTYHWSPDGVERIMLKSFFLTRKPPTPSPLPRTSSSTSSTSSQ